MRLKLFYIGIDLQDPWRLAATWNNHKVYQKGQGIMNIVYRSKCYGIIAQFSTKKKKTCKT